MRSQSATSNARGGRRYRHTVINAAHKSEYSTLAHELAHDMVSHLQLPLWINEGLAQWAEQLAPAYPPEPLKKRDARLQHRYWRRFGINRFWTGEAFHSPGSQRLAYQLSRILFHNLATHPTRRLALPNFITTASPKDAGQSASLASFNVPLTTLATEFLGPGNWTHPLPKTP